MQKPIVATAAALAVAMLVSLSGSTGSFAVIEYAKPSVRNLTGHGGIGHAESYREALAAAQYQAMRTGELDPLRAQEAVLAATEQAAAVGQATGLYGQRWKELGPRPYNTSYGVVSGRVSSLAIDPSDASGNTVYVGTAGGGVWVTRNGGKVWKPLWDARNEAAIGAIAIDPKNPKRIYVGTGEGALASLTVFRGTGVYRSLDGGKTFARVARNVKGNVIMRIEVSGKNLYVASDLGLWRSVDGGNSYHDVKLPTNADASAPAAGQWANVVTDVRIHPSKPNQITAAVGWQGGSAGGPGNGLYRSTTFGSPGSWERMDVSTIKTLSKTDDGFGRTALAYARGPGQDHDILWAVVQDPGMTRNIMRGGFAKPVLYSSVLNGVYRSGDDGSTWELKAVSETLAGAPGSAQAITAALGYAPGVQAWYNNYVEVSPKNADVVVVGLEEVYQTTAGANTPGLASWTTIGRYTDLCLSQVCTNTLPAPSPYAGDSIHPDQHAAAFTSDGTRLYAGNDGGVYVQNQPDGVFDNQSWDETNATLGTTQPYYATIARDGTVYAGFQDNGTSRINPDGYAYEVYGGDGGDVAVEPDNSQIAWEEYTYADIRVTKNGGATWVSNAPAVNGAQFIAPFEMDPRNPKHVVLGAREIMETVKGGDTVCTDTSCDWMKSYDLGQNTAVAGNPNFSTSAVDVLGAVVYAGFCGPCLPVRQGAYDEALLTSGLATNRKPGCTPQTGTGACWHRASAKGLPNRFITDVTIDPQNPSTIYVTLAGWQRRWIPPGSRSRNVGRGHVFVSRNAGESFVDITKNLPAVPAEAIDVKGTRLFVGTHLGVFTTDAAGKPWQRLGSGLPISPVVDLNLNPQGDTVLAATHGRGIWAVRITAAGKKARAGGVQER